MYHIRQGYWVVEHRENLQFSKWNFVAMQSTIILNTAVSKWTQAYSAIERTHVTLESASFMLPLILSFKIQWYIPTAKKSASVGNFHTSVEASEQIYVNPLVHLDCYSYHISSSAGQRADRVWGYRDELLKCHLDNYPLHEGALRLNWPRAGHLDFEEIRKRPE